MGSNKAEIEISASTSRLPAALRAAAKMVQGFVHATTGMLEARNRKVDRPDAKSLGVGAFAGNLGANLAMRGIDLMVDQGKEVLDFEKALVRFGISARKTPAEMRAIGNEARRTAELTGQNALEVLKGGRGYIDLAGAQNFTIDKMNLLARAAQASGAETADLTGMMYQLTRSMKVSDDQMEATMGGLINQSKDGAIEARQMAKEFGAILPLFARFGVVGQEGAVQAGALFQTIRDGYNTADEAGTGLVRILAGLRTYASRFENAGVKIWNVDKDGFKRARSFAEIFKDISTSKLVKDPELLKKAFGRSEAWRGIEIALENTKRIKELEDAGRRGGSTIQQDLATFVESSSGRMEVAMERMKNAVATAFSPERIEKFAGVLEGLVDKADEVAGAVGKIGDAFGVIYNAGKRVRQFVDGGSEYQLTDADKEALGEERRQQRTSGMVDPQARARADAVRARKAEYDKAIADVLASEKDDRPTDESIRKAIKIARSDMGPDKATTAAGNAARAYLADRKGDISQDRYRKIDAELAAEERRVAQQKKTAGDPAVRDLNANVVGKILSDAETAKAIGRAVADAIGLKILGTGSPVVELDGNRVSKGTSNAPNRRRKP